MTLPLATRRNSSLNIDNATCCGAAGILAEGTFTTSRTVTLALANGTIGVSCGNTFTLGTGLTYSAAANTFAKTENGTLVLLGAASGSPTSGTAINAGAIKPISSAALGSGTITIGNTIGAALQIDPARPRRDRGDLHPGLVARRQRPPRPWRSGEPSTAPISSAAR